MLAANDPGSQESALSNVPDAERRAAETRLWLQVLNLHRIVYADLNTALSERFGLSVPKFDVLSHLHRYPEGLAMGELSRKLKVSNGNVSGLIARLGKDGYLHKEMTKDDRRSFRARLTDHGRRVFEEALDVHRQVVAAAMASSPTPQIDRLTEGLKALVKGNGADGRRDDRP